MTETIRSRTTSSPDESLASNLQFDTVLLIAVIASPRSSEAGCIIPDTKKVCSDIRAAEVIGPVEREERINARKGARTVGSESSLLSASQIRTL